MRVVAYSVKPFEKEPLSRANQKKHDITLISNSLGAETAEFARGKDAVVVAASDDLSAPVVIRLAGLGVKYIAARAASVSHINRDTALKWGIKISVVPEDNIAEVIANLDKWQENKCVGKACACAAVCAAKEQR
ncbi:lactate dehydrogenase [Hufsiella ginkgonis]|uniref:Lactate dehydrogenase n=1 Tax=Hufsiella ginkgonis TaxID=2695274 RepID=A0A7K1Y0D2_9SPHI|nr:lactate dehydrogenase [Hufsiella ginkgonis]MXV16741.1 lactate dehydrogenase [Hufsiella ginkgonis]